jgi:hypothetical protein
VSKRGLCVEQLSWRRSLPQLALIDVFYCSRVAVLVAAVNGQALVSGLKVGLSSEPYLCIGKTRVSYSACDDIFICEEEWHSEFIL